MCLLQRCWDICNDVSCCSYSFQRTEVQKVEYYKMSYQERKNSKFIYNLNWSNLINLIDLRVAQYLYTNISYVSGVIPIKYLYTEGRLVLVDTWWSRSRWFATICISTVIKTLFVTSVARDYSSGYLHMKNLCDIIRCCVAFGISFLGFMDIHTMWKLTEIISTSNMSNQFYERFSCKLVRIPADHQVLNCFGSSWFLVSMYLILL